MTDKLFAGITVLLLCLISVYWSKTPEKAQKDKFTLPMIIITMITIITDFLLFPENYT